MARSRTALFALALGALADAAVLHYHPSSFLGFEYDPSKKQDSTADAKMCTHIYMASMLCVVLQIVGFYGEQNNIYQGGSVGILFCAAWAVGYALTHGLMSAWYEGGHNLTEHCAFVGLFGLIMAFEVALVLCCVGVFVVVNGIAKMKAATLQRSATLSSDDQKYLESEEFQTKCTEAFKKADKDGNGKLDLAELQDVVLFDLSPEQQKKVKAEKLFKQAFEECDANHDNMIDPDEFLVVMKFVRSHAMDPV